MRIGRCKRARRRAFEKQELATLSQHTIDILSRCRRTQNAREQQKSSHAFFLDVVGVLQAMLQDAALRERRAQGEVKKKPSEPQG